MTVRLIRVDGQGFIYLNDSLGVCKGCPSDNQNLNTPGRSSTLLLVTPIGVILSTFGPGWRLISKNPRFLKNICRPLNDDRINGLQLWDVVSILGKSIYREAEQLPEVPGQNI